MSEPSLNAWLSALTLGLLILTVAVVIALIRPVPTLVTVDIKGTVAAFREPLMESHLSTEQQNERIAAFTQAMEDALQTLAEREHVIIAVEPAIVAGSRDVTPALQAMIVEAMQAQGGPREDR